MRDVLGNQARAHRGAAIRTEHEHVVAERLGALDGTNPRVVVAGNFATPWTLLGLATATISELRAFVLNAQDGWPARDGLVTETPFVGPGCRRDPAIDYLPMRLSLVPRLFATLRQPDVVLLHTTTPRQGKVSLGIEVNILPSAIESVRRRGGLVVAQLNPQMPYTYGDAEVDLDDIDLGLEVDARLPSPAGRTVDDVAEAIGAHVARFASDGGTIQLGIGAVPDAAGRQLMARRGLRVWSELVSDGIMELERAGALDAGEPLHTSFLFGSPELYQWADANRRVEVLRTETINDPSRIASRPAMLSVNTALQVDLAAQANASHVGGSIFSGFGGQPDFVVGALHSAGGHAAIALRSWHGPTGASTVVGRLATPVCTFQHSVIVTEHGCAEIFGRSQRAQARQIIAVAHPRAREALAAAAQAQGLA